MAAKQALHMGEDIQRFQWQLDVQEDMFSRFQRHIVDGNIKILELQGSVATLQNVQLCLFICLFVCL